MRERITTFYIVSSFEKSDNKTPSPKIMNFWSSSTHTLSKWEGEPVNEEYPFSQNADGCALGAVNGHSTPRTNSRLSTVNFNFSRLGEASSQVSILNRCSRHRAVVGISASWVTILVKKLCSSKVKSILEKTQQLDHVTPRTHLYIDDTSLLIRESIKLHSVWHWKCWCVRNGLSGGWSRRARQVGHDSHASSVLQFLLHSIDRPPMARGSWWVMNPDDSPSGRASQKPHTTIPKLSLMLLLGAFWLIHQ
jgi:hypothetical protein